MRCLARLMRCAIVASGTRNAAALSAVVRPPTPTSCSASCERRRGAVHVTTTFHGVLFEGDKLGRHLDRRVLARVADTGAGQRLLALGERPGGRHRDTVLEADGLRLARVNEAL